GPGNVRPGFSRLPSGGRCCWALSNELSPNQRWRLAHHAEQRKHHTNDDELYLVFSKYSEDLQEVRLRFFRHRVTPGSTTHSPAAFEGAQPLSGKASTGSGSNRLHLGYALVAVRSKGLQVHEPCAIHS